MSLNQLASEINCGDDLGLGERIAWIHSALSEAFRENESLYYQIHYGVSVDPDTEVILSRLVRRSAYGRKEDDYPEKEHDVAVLKNAGVMKAQGSAPALVEVLIQTLSILHTMKVDIDSLMKEKMGMTRANGKKTNFN